MYYSVSIRCSGNVCLAGRWLGIDFRSDSSIPAFRRHVTILSSIKRGRSSYRRMNSDAFPTETFNGMTMYYMRLKTVGEMRYNNETRLSYRAMQM
jgi:hypothetical protein